MSISRLTDSEVRERIVAVNDVEMLEKLAGELNDRTLYSCHIFHFPGGIRVHVLDQSCRSVIDEDCALPTISDDMFTTAGKRKRIREVADRVRKLIRDNGPKGAA